MFVHCSICNCPLLRDQDEVNRLAREADDGVMLRVTDFACPIRMTYVSQVREARGNQVQLQNYFKRNRAQSCGHMFHESCIYKWFQRQNLDYPGLPETCPICVQRCYLDGTSNIIALLDPPEEQVNDDFQIREFIGGGLIFLLNLVFIFLVMALVNNWSR